jgi:fumarate hydratase subunit alpha
MKKINQKKIKKAIASLCLKANYHLRPDLKKAILLALRKEKNKRAKVLLSAILQNARIAQREKLAICQDTGLPCVFLEIGEQVKVIGDLKQAIQAGVAEGYEKGYLRKSIIQNPLCRAKSAYTPAVMHIDIVKGDKLKITLLPKGFGCENKTQLKMFAPTAKIEEIKKFIVAAVKSAGPDACPPYVVGVGIGGTADYACFLAKKALLRPIRTPHLRVGNLCHTRKSVVRLETELLQAVNALNIGPMGLGGKTTALAVNIETYPTHIAGLPVCVNISCHALRSATTTL